MESIGPPGTYRRFVHVKKDQKVQWAVEMTHHVNIIHAAMKELMVREQELKNSHTLHMIYPVWQCVIDSNLPPTDLPLTIGTCVISKKQNIPCILVRGKGRGAQPYMVSNRFTPFFFKIWILSKIDILIKVYTRGSISEYENRHRKQLQQQLQQSSSSSCSFPDCSTTTDEHANSSNDNNNNNHSNNNDDAAAAAKQPASTTTTTTTSATTTAPATKLSLKALGQYMTTEERLVDMRALARAFHQAYLHVTASVTHGLTDVV